MKLKVRRPSDIHNMLELYSVFKAIIPEGESIFENFFLPKDLEFDRFIKFCYKKNYINKSMESRYYKNLENR